MKETIENPTPKDYVLEIVEEKDHAMEIYKYFFRDLAGFLISYIKVHILNQTGGKVGYVIDLTSANGFKHMSSGMQDFYRKNGYDENHVVPDFGRNSFAIILKDIKMKYPDVNIINVSALGKNEEAVWSLVRKVQSGVENLIKALSGGGERHVCTIFI